MGLPLPPCYTGNMRDLIRERLAGRPLGKGLQVALATAALLIIGFTGYANLAYPQTLDLQATCATQAKKVFQEWETEAKGFGSKRVSADYQSHYNTKIKKCLVLINTLDQVGGEFLTGINLLDAFERRYYASYGWSSKPGKKYWEVPPLICELIPSSRQKKICTTQEEFEAFVAEYMEE
jgi:hypothetical protein